MKSVSGEFWNLGFFFSRSCQPWGNGPRHQETKIKGSAVTFGCHC